MKISSILFKAIIIIRISKYWLVGKFLGIYLSLLGCKVGKGLKCKSWPLFRMVPKSNIIIGNNVTIGYRISLDILPTGKLKIGDHVNLTQDILISSYNSVSIGAYSLIAERVSIRDEDHGISNKEKIFSQEIISKPINIGDDVWIGANSIILKGSNIPDGCVVGANSVILSNSVLESNGVYAGNPLKMIKKRK